MAKPRFERADYSQNLACEPNCPNCDGMGFIVPAGLMPGDRGFGRAVPCDCQAAIGKQRLLQNSGLQPNEYEWELAIFQRKPGKSAAFQAASALLKQAPRPTGWISLYGRYGVGKSGVLKALTAHLIRIGVRAVYRRAEDILSEARATFADDPQAHDASEQAVRQRYGRYPFLAVDEIDRIPATPWARTFIYAIMDDRYNKRGQVATAMATNAMPGQMGGQWEYLESRMSDGQRIVMAGRSLRGVGHS
jgi:DNA replication protein DnaC